MGESVAQWHAISYFKVNLRDLININSQKKLFEINNRKNFKLKKVTGIVLPDTF